MTELDQLKRWLANAHNSIGQLERENAKLQKRVRALGEQLSHPNPRRRNHRPRVNGVYLYREAA